MYSAIVSKRRRQECSRYLSLRMLAPRWTCDLLCSGGGFWFGQTVNAECGSCGQFSSNGPKLPVNARFDHPTILTTTRADSQRAIALFRTHSKGPGVAPISIQVREGIRLLPSLVGESEGKHESSPSINHCH